MRLAGASQQPDMPAQLMAQLLASDLLAPDAAERLNRVLACEGRDLAAMVSRGERAPLRWFREIYPALDVEQASRLGFAAGEQARLTSFAQLSLPLVSAASVSEVLQLLAFLPLLSNSLTARSHARADDIVIVLEACTGDPVLDRFPIFYGAAALAHLLEMLVADSPSLRVHIAWPAPAFIARLPAAVQARLHFDARAHEIIVPRSSLEAVCRFPDPIAYRGAMQDLETRLAALHAADDIAAQVRALLEVPERLPGIEAVADRLHMSVSTLKRRLAEHDTSYTALRDEVLQQRALALLGDASLTLDAIATELGYSDCTNFSHAFKRWTGRSPGAYRRGMQTRAS